MWGKVTGEMRENSRKTFFCSKRRSKFFAAFSRGLSDVQKLPWNSSRVENSAPDLQNLIQNRYLWILDNFWQKVLLEATKIRIGSDSLGSGTESQGPRWAYGNNIWQCSPTKMLQNRFLVILSEFCLKIEFFS